MIRMLLLASLSVSCASPRVAPSVNALAEQYVKLVLAVGVHDPAYVDMYYGPFEWLRTASEERTPIPVIRERAVELLDLLHEPRKDTARVRFLQEQVAALIQRADLLAGAHLSFDDESRGLFGITAPPFAESSMRMAVAELDRQLPGSGPVASRLEAYSRRMAVPDDRLKSAVETALAACRARTAAHLSLPEGERVEVAYVHDQPWSAYAKYEGGFRTRIDINVDLPRRPDQILDLMCHEGYPGHHTQYSLLEQRMVRARGWQEFQVLPLLSPASAWSEAAATAGVEVAFDAEDRRTFEREVLFPAAGVSASEVDRMSAVRHLTAELAAAGTEAARRYLDGRMTRADAVLWLERNAAMPRPQELLGFVDQFRSYVVGYTAGAASVRRDIDRAAEVEPAARWRAFERVILHKCL
jgi:hypothetical protein